MSDWGTPAATAGDWGNPTASTGWAADSSIKNGEGIASSSWGGDEAKTTKRNDSPHLETVDAANADADEPAKPVDLEADLPISREENVKNLQAKGWAAQLGDSAAVAESGRYTTEWQFGGIHDTTVADEDKLIDLDKDRVQTTDHAPLGFVGPRVEALEKKLYDAVLFGIKGKNLQAFEIESDFSGENAPASEIDKKAWKVDTFAQAGLHPILVENLKLAGYDSPTPVQQWSLKAILTGRDILLTAATGSGKTAAYLIPVINKFFGKVNLYCKPRPELGEEEKYIAEPIILIIVPTRELASQIFYEVARLSYRSLLRPCAVYGGGPVKAQLEELRKGCDIVVGTFGRLLDFIKKDKLSLKRVRAQVIDEADEVCKEDHQEDLSSIFLGAPNMTDANNQLVIASATWSEEVMAIAKDLLAEDHWQIQLGRPGSTHVNIKQQFIECEPHEKKAKLFELLDAIEKPERTIVFVNAKPHAQKIDDFIFRLGYPCTILTGDMTQREREDAVRAFTLGTAPIMVCSSLAARGIDIPDVAHVINFDLPSMMHGGVDEYVNRIGRTGRIGHEGRATSFFTKRDEDMAAGLVNLFKETEQEIPDLLQNLIAEPPASEAGGTTSEAGEGAKTEIPGAGADNSIGNVSLLSEGDDNSSSDSANSSKISESSQESEGFHTAVPFGSTPNNDER